MSEKAGPAAPGDGDDDGDGDGDVLRRAAREIRATPSLSALVPLAPDEREAIADAAIGRALASAPSPRHAPGRSWSRRRTAVAIAAAATMAIAAAIALVVARRDAPPVAPLPRYAMAVAGEQALRGSIAPGAPGTPGDAAAPVHVRPETRLVLTLTAEAPERDALLRVVFVRDGRATVLDPPVARDRAGVVTIAGPASELLGAQRDGVGELVVVLGRALPSDDEIRRLTLGASAPPHLQLLRRAVVLDGFSHAAVDVLLGGCAAVLETGDRPRCEVVPGAPLRVWVGSAAAVSLTVDGRPLGARAVARGGGVAFELGAPSGLLAIQVDDREVAAWSLAPAATFAHVAAADRALGAGRLDEAATALDAVSPGATAEERLEAVRRRARIARRRGELGRERELREQAVAQARTLHRASVEVDETIAIINGLVADHALAAAAQRLATLDTRGGSYAEGLVDRELYRGVIASELGDLGVALAAFRRALAVTERIGDAAGAALIHASQADTLQALGRDREARALVEAEIQRSAHDPDVCARTDALTNAAWLLRDAEPPRAQGLADQAAALAAASCRHLVAITLVNQGWLLARAGRHRDARAVLEQLAAMPRERDGKVITWVLRLEAEIVLGEDPARAEQYARRLAGRASALCSSELAYEAHLLRARALVALGRAAEADAAFADAERALAVWSRLVPLGEGRSMFFHRHEQLALAAIPHLLDGVKRGRPGAARALAGTVRRSIARFVDSLAHGGRIRARAARGDTDRDRTSKLFERALERWPASDAAVTAPPGVCEARDDAMSVADPADVPPAHATLLVHPTPRGLLLLVWRAPAIVPRELAAPRPEESIDELAARIAEAAAPLLAGAPRVHLHVHHALASLPLDRHLAATLAVPIAFAVDAPARPGTAACTGARRALFVTDPLRDLGAAGDAARVAQRAVARLGFEIDTLVGAAATREALEARLADPCTALFHYDGHAIAEGSARDRTDDALALAGGDTLTAADVLGLSRVPAAVVLNGCTTAAPEGLGLAQAFVLAGARQVIASLEAIPADDAARFTATLFDAPPGRDGELDLVRLHTHASAAAELPIRRAVRAFERSD